MKKAKRFLTGLLSAALALSLCAMPAMAEGGTGADTSGTTPVTAIDTGRKGTLTIYKYLMEDTSDGKTNSPTANEGQTIPAGAEAVDGVGFTIYQVMNADELVGYYKSGSKSNTVTVDTYLTTDSTTGKQKVVKNDNDVQPYRAEVKTGTVDGKKGVAKFEDLDVGLYVVMETTKPVSVTAAVAPFFISIPMTRIADDNGHTANTEWQYDVVVYPKNSTKKGNVTIVKKGAVGDSSDSNAADLKNVSFKLQWYNDTTEEWEDKTTITTGQDGKFTVEDLNKGKYRFIETSNDDSKYILDLNETYEFEIDQDGYLKVPESTEITTNTKDYVINKDSATITIYNYKPDLNKQVKKRTGDSWVEGTDYNVGDTVSYKISVTVPSNITKLAQFDVEDTPKHLIDDADSIVVKCGDELLTKDTHYTVVPGTKDETTGSNGFTIKFVTTEMATYAGKTLTITYNAELSDKAVTTIDGNPNTAKLIYTNKINENGQPNKDSKEEIHDETIVYTFEIDIVKISDQQGEDGKPEKLQGVKFKLYKVATDGDVTGSEIGLKGDDANLNLKLVKDELVTDKNGKVSVSGLSNGTYYLVETETKAGYNLLSEPVKVELNVQYKETWDESKTYENGVLTKHDVTVNREKEFGNVTDKTIGAVTNTIINRKGFNLPTTGGFGTLLFSGIGVLLVVAGVGVLLSLKKKNRA